MDLLEWDETFEEVTLHLELELEDLHPIGYRYKNGQQYIVLLGGKDYVFKGTVSIHALRKTGIDVSDVHLEVEGNLETTLDDDDPQIYRLTYREDYLDCESTVYGIAELPFKLKPVRISTESYEGLDAFVNYSLSTTIIQGSRTVASLSIPFYVSMPMPIPSIPLSTTSVFSIYDQLQLAIHFDRTTFAVNDIVTGWVQILHAKHSFSSVQLRFKKIEQLFLRDESGRSYNHTNISLSEPFEIMDTIYPLCADSDKKPKAYKDVSFQAFDQWDDEESALEESVVGKIPFSMFIRELGGISPSVSRVKGILSVNWQLELIIRDLSRIEYIYDTDIDIVRGEIVSLFLRVC